MTTQEIEKYLVELQQAESDFKNISGVALDNCRSGVKAIKLKHIKLAWFIVCSIVDYCLLNILAKYFRSYLDGKKIVFTTRSFCTEINGVLEDRIVRPLFKDNVIWINYSKERYLTQINKSKVYNISGVVNLLRIVQDKKLSNMTRTLLSYRAVNDSIIRHLKGNQVYTLCYYDLNGLSLAFSNYRYNMQLCEVQHGSIVNYPPYEKPSPIQIADVFYVKNKNTINYLKTHLCKEYDPEYRLIPYQSSDRIHIPGIHILYASTMEFNGLHPVFSEFLANSKDEELHVIVRLHPRERDKKIFFRQLMSQFKVNYEFDTSKNWLEGNNIKNLYVISPWSSVIEDAYDNGFTVIIIDSVGRDRYAHLIDGERCLYSEDLPSTIAKLTQIPSENESTSTV